MTNKKFYTSLNLSEKLKKGGCKLKSEYKIYNKYKNSITCTIKGAKEQSIGYGKCYPAYHILEDICVRYAKEFFGNELWSRVSGDVYYSWEFFTRKIFKMLQQGETQEEIEDYIWKNCLFNKNKKND